MTETKKPGSSARIASIDWMRGLVMVLMIIDHAGMAFDGGHFSTDSVTMYESGQALPAIPFFSRWMTHICAPAFVFLAGTALALSIERRVQRGADPKQIDRGILIRGAIIALIDPTLISLTSGRWTLQVMYAIGVAMMAMALLRRLPTIWLIVCGLGWFAIGEWVTFLLWDPAAGWASIPVGATMGIIVGSSFKIVYPVLPWLAMMVLGWAFGRALVTRLQAGDVDTPRRWLWAWGLVGVAAFCLVRWWNGYGNMLLLRDDNSWQHWLHVSKYPPSLSFAALELGLVCLGLAMMMVVERHITVRKNGFLIVLGQTSMFFYLVHRLVYESLATWCGLRGVTDLATVYIVSVISLALLYPACLWYRGFKKAHPTSWLKYF